MGGWRGVPSSSWPLGLAPVEPTAVFCRRDLEDMRLELGQERAKRQALQVSWGHRAVPAAPPPPPLTASPRRWRWSR